jgi:transcriptional regulator with XRE-family HTH domain
MFINRLKEYKEKSGMTFRAMEDATDISSTTLQKIITSETLEDLKWVSLGSYKTLREKLGVDLLD